MALTSRKQVEEFADKLSECADSGHKRLIKAINDNEIDQVTAQSIFQNEIILRQHANSLYIDAAICAVEELSESQENLVKLIDAAKEKIKTIERIATFVDLISDLIVLSAAAYAAKPAPILAALREIREDIKALEGDE